MISQAASACAHDRMLQCSQFTVTKCSTIQEPNRAVNYTISFPVPVVSVKKLGYK